MTNISCLSYFIVLHSILYVTSCSRKAALFTIADYDGILQEVVPYKKVISISTTVINTAALNMHAILVTVYQLQHLICSC